MTLAVSIGLLSPSRARAGVSEADAPTAAQIDAMSGEEVLAQTGTNEVHVDRTPVPLSMSPEGVSDPFPDQPRRARPRDAGIVLGLGFGFAVASTITARLTLLPDCEDENDVMTCAVPDGQDIGVRGGRLFGTIGFSVGAAAFGAFGARELGQVLQQADGALARRRRVAVGLGTSSLAIGLTGAIVGATLLGVGARRGLAAARAFESTTGEVSSAELAVLEDTVGQVEVARAGLMVLAASPFFVASGISLLVHRPRPRRVVVTPTLGATEVGVTARIRF